MREEKRVCVWLFRFRILVVFDIAFLQIVVLKEAQQEQNALFPTKVIIKISLKCCVYIIRIKILVMSELRLPFDTELDRNTYMLCTEQFSKKVLKLKGALLSVFL